jgi:hypothetical protein
MSRWFCGFIVLSSAVAFAAPPQGSNVGVGEVAQEIRKEISDIHEALGEVTSQRNNREEICFRIGMLYMTARHELEEVVAGQKDLSAPAKTLGAELIKDGRSLPSFCEDKEKVSADPGYEQVKHGDVADLKRELANMDRRAKGLLPPPAGGGGRGDSTGGG